MGNQKKNKKRKKERTKKWKGGNTPNLILAGTPPQTPLRGLTAFSTIHS